MVYLVRMFKTPAEFLDAVMKKRAKLHVWEKGKGDLQGDRSGLIIYDSPEHRWKAVVELRGGIIVKANLAED